MSYLIFLKDKNNIEGSLYAIAETQNDLDNLNIVKSDYKILEISNDEFNLVKNGIKSVIKYNDDAVIYNDSSKIFKNKVELSLTLESYKQKIKNFLDNNPNHLLFNKWNNYYNQLNSLDLNLITFPLNKSLEQHFNDLGQPSLNILQIP